MPIDGSTRKRQLVQVMAEMKKEAGSSLKGSSSCVSCKKKFHPNPRLGKRQKTCGDESCGQKQRAKYRNQYRKTNEEAERGYEAKRRAARGKNYWQRYRAEHPESTARNRAGSRLRRKLQKAGLQRQLDIVQLIDPIETLAVVVGFATSHRSLLEECLCKPTG